MSGQKQQWSSLLRRPLVPHIAALGVYRDKLTNLITNIMTKLMTATFILLTLVSCGQQKLEQDKSKERINNVCDNFMKAFVEGKTEDALELLKQNTVMKPSEIDSLKVTISEQKENIFPQFGKILSS